MAGRITPGTAMITACTVTFATAYAIAPACTVTSDENAYTLEIAVSATGFVLGITGVSFSADEVSYICIGI